MGMSADIIVIGIFIFCCAPFLKALYHFAKALAHIKVKGAKKYFLYGPWIILFSGCVDEQGKIHLTKFKQSIIIFILFAAPFVLFYIFAG